MNVGGSRGRLFRKYVIVLLVLMGGVLMASSLVELYFSYRETQRSIVRVERAKAVAAAAGIEQLLGEIEQQVRETTRTASDDPDASQVGQGRLGFRQGLGAAMAEQRELDFLRVLRNVPAVSELRHLDLAGKEQLRVSRLDPDVAGSQEDFSKSPKFLEAKGGKTYWSPVYLKNEAEPFVTLAVPVGKYAVEVTTAEVSLGPVIKLVTQIDVGPGGYAYVVDSRNRLVAHPDRGMLREFRDLSGLSQVKAARMERPAPGDAGHAAVVADGLSGGRVLAAHAAIPPLGWFVFVERPAADAYAPLRAPIIRSAVIFVLGLLLSILASLLLARRMVAPIRVLQEGATRIGAGTLDQPIQLRTGDEIEGLALSFNQMAANLKESYESLEQKVEARTRELADANRGLTEALEQQTATSEILRVISSSPTDVQPVFDAIAREARRLCNASYSVVGRYDGRLVHLAAHEHVRPEGVQAMQQLFPLRPSRATTTSRSILDRAVVHVPDVLEDPDYDRSIAFGIQNRSTLAVPMLLNGEPIGTISVGRLEPLPFSQTQITLLQTFADQAVIAIENVRLFKELEVRNSELTDTLARQTATGEVLRAISRAQTDAQPVFDIIASSAMRLCNAAYCSLCLYDSDQIRVATIQNVDPAAAEALQRVFPLPVDDGTLPGRVIRARTVMQIPDVAADPGYRLKREIQAMGFRSLLAVPLLRDGEPVGTINVGRIEPGEFSSTQIELLQTFADQAVIAVENVRLFKELEARNRDLTEALEQQTATAEILRVISSSPTDVQPVFDTIVENARSLCGADSAGVLSYDGALIHVEALDNNNPERSNALRQAYPLPADRRHITGRAILTGLPVQVADIREDPEYGVPTLRDAVGLRTLLSVPMVREGVPIGAITVQRWDTPRPFSDKQIALLQTFADQAVIAVQNVRLFKELDARNRDLTESLAQQTATAEVLKAISRSTFDLQPVLEALIENATQLCGATQGFIFRRTGDEYRLAADYQAPAAFKEWVAEVPIRPGDGRVVGRVAQEGRTVQILDAQADPVWKATHTDAVGMGEVRSLLGVPMLREGRLVGVIAMWRRVVQPFTDKQIELVTTFADQAVIAIENVRLLKELQERTQELTRSVEELRALGEVGRAVSSTLDFQSVLASIVSHAVELSHTDAGTIYEFDEAAEVFVPQANYGMSEELIETLRQTHIGIGVGETGIGQAAATRRAVQIPDLEKRAGYALAFMVRAGFRSLLAVPLLQEERVIGGLVVRRKVEGEFPQAVVDLLQTFATQSVIAIQNARLFREIDEKSRALEELSRNQEQLSRLSTALQEPLSLTEQLTRVLDAARQVVGLDHLYIWTPSPAGDGLMVSAGAGLTEKDAQALLGVTIPFGEAGALAAVYGDGEPRLFNEANPVPEKYHLRPPYSTIAALRLKAFLVSPMIARGRTVGVLSADNRVSRTPIAAHTVDLLHTFAAQAAVAVENARLFQEIQEKGQQLELASRHKSQFLANMSHELRTPMNAVLGYTDLILDNIFGEVPEAIRDTLERVKSNGQHLLGLINDVLDLSKIEAGQLTLSLGDYAMGEVVYAVVSAVESLAAGKKLGFEATVAPDLPPGRGDERRLTQVLLNLAGNAIKFTDAGKVSIDARAADGSFVVSVTDTGPGISEGDQVKIFEEFQQADSSSTRAKGGSGLGLSISRRIVELHGGRLWVESVLGHGSTFSFTVPLRVEWQAGRA